MGTPSYGAKDSLLAFDTALPFDSSSIPMIFLSETLTKEHEILQDEGLRGLLDMSVERTRNGKEKVSGQVVFEMSPTMAASLIPSWGFTAAGGGVFTLAETVSSHYLMIAKGAKDFTFNNCIASKITIKSEAGRKVIATVDLEAESTTTSASGTLSAIGLTVPTDKPWSYSDLVCTAFSSARDIFDHEIVIDNKIDAERWVNAINRANMTSQGREIMFNITTPFSSSETDLIASALAGSTGSSSVYTNADAGTNVMTLAFGTIQFPKTIPTVGGKGEIKLGLNGRLLKTGSTKPLQITIAP